MSLRSLALLCCLAPGAALRVPAVLMRQSSSEDSALSRRSLGTQVTAAGLAVLAFGSTAGAGPLATAAAEPEDLKVLRAYLFDNKVDTAKAAKELGVTIAANNNALVGKNAFQKYYGRPFIIQSIKATPGYPTTPFLEFMMGVVAKGPAKFTFEDGYYKEENVRGVFYYTTTGFVSDSEMVTFAKGNGPPEPGTFGTIKVGQESTDNYMVSTGYSKARGHYTAILNAETKLSR